VAPARSIIALAPVDRGADAALGTIVVHRYLRMGEEERPPRPMLQQAGKHLLLSGARGPRQAGIFILIGQLCGCLLVHARKRSLQRLVISIEGIGLLCQRALWIPMLQAQRVAMIEVANGFFAFERPLLEWGEGAPGLEEVAPEVRPAKGKNDPVGQPRELLIGAVVVADDNRLLVLQPGEMRPGHGGTAAGIDAVEHHRGRTRYPQIPTGADLVRQLQSKKINMLERRK